MQTGPRRILIVRPSALGDVCRTTPVLVSLKRAWPEAAIDWLVQREFADAIRAHPDLGTAVPFDRRALGAALRRLDPSGALRYMSDLRRARYDLVVDAQGLFRSGVLAWATGARRRVGDRAARELAWLCYTQRVRTDPAAHTVDRMLALLKGVGVAPAPDTRLYAPPDERERLDGAHPGLADGGYVVVAPTARWAAKRWAAERYARVCERLLERGVARVVVVGGAGERGQCGPLIDLGERDPRVLDLVGRTSVGALMALIERCELFLGSDSAALHIAVGFRRPLVALYGPTRADLVGPYKRELDVIQHIEPEDILDHKDARGARMMERIGVDEVADACLERLATGHADPAERAGVCGSSA